MKIYTPICALAAIATLASCSNDDATISPLPEKTYSGNTALRLEYNSSPMSGKSVTYIQNGDNANFEMGSTVSLEELSPAFKGIPPIPGPGVLPGTSMLSLPVKLQTDGSKYSFEGSGETEYVTYNYSGNVNADVMDFKFRNVLLKNQRLANSVWIPAPTERDATGLGYKSLPLHIIWECSLPPVFEGFDGTIQDALVLMATLPIIPAYNNTAYMSLVQIIGNALKTIAFRPDGNAVVTYLQSNNGAAQFTQAPICMIQYLPLNENMLKLFINLTDLMGQILINGSSHPDLPPNPFGRGNSTTPDIIPIISRLAPMISEGFPMQYTIDPTSLQIYFNTETLLPLLKGVVVPLLKDPAIQEMIIEKISENPALAGHLTLIKVLIAAFPELLDTTTRIELGFNFVPYTTTPT